MEQPQVWILKGQWGKAEGLLLKHLERQNPPLQRGAAANRAHTEPALCSDSPLAQTSSG